MQEWEKMLLQAVKMCEVLRDGWRKTEEKEIVHYFG